MGTKYAEYVVSVKGPDKQLQEITVKSKSAQDALRQIGNAAAEASKRMQTALNAVAFEATTRAIDSVKQAITDVAAAYQQFDRSMRAVNTMAGKSGAELDALTASVSELGKQIPLTRDELAGGLYQVISNGVPEDNWITFLEQSAKAAVGGIADLGQTVTVTSTIIKNYGLAWSDAQAVQDMIQTTAKNGVTSFEQLAASLPAVSGTAAQLGVGLKELMAVFATTTGVTGNTAAVATQLGAVLKALVKPSSEASKAAEAMGIQFDAAAVRAAGGLDPFLKKLNADVQEYSARTGELSESIYAKLFGSVEALRILGSLTGEQAQTFTANIEAMASSAGTIDEAFGEMSSTAEAGRVMWQNQLAAMTDWAGAVASAMQPTLGFMSSLGASISTVMTLRSGIVSMTAALGKSSLVLNITKAATAAYAAMQKVLNVALLGCPVTWFAGAVVAVGVALRAMYLHCEPFREWVDEMTAKMQPMIAAFIRLGKVIIENVVSALRWFVDVLKDVWDYVVKFFGLDGKTIEVKTRANVEVTPTGDAGGDVALEQLLASVQGGSGNSGKAAKPAAEKQTQLERLTAANPVGDARNFSYLQQFTDRIAYLEELAKTASQKEYIALQQQIKQTERLRKAFMGEGDLSWQDARGGRLASVASTDAASYAFGTAMRQLPKALPKDFKLNNPLPTKEIKKDSATISQCLDGLGVAMGNLSGALGDNAGAWLSYASNVLQSVAKMIPALLALTSAEFAEKSSALPPPLNVINMVASMAAVAAAFASLPKFADGGIAYGPTVGVFGEYPGASNNPEVVAPLNKLKDLIVPAGGPGVGGEVTFRIEGRDLVGVITKYNRYNSHVK